MKLILIILFSFFISLQIQAQPDFETLPKLNLRASDVSISGISSGAAMASQFAVAHPELIKKVGLFAGPVWACALGNADRAQDLCMKTPEKLSFLDIQQHFNLGAGLDWAKAQELSHLQIYVWHGLKDSRVQPFQAELQKQFWSQFVSSSQLRINTYLAFEHLFPTVDKGGSCKVAAIPFIGNCDFAATEEMFDFFYPGQKISSKQQLTSPKLKSFKQSTYLTPTSQMHPEGFIYIPEACSQGESCHLHIALHGCKQTPEFIDRQFAELTGYLESAERRKMVVLFPNMSPSRENPFGCWDWWGYTGADYLKRQAPQIQSIVNMLKALGL